MNKQQQIEEIAKVIFDYVDSRTDNDKVVSIHIFNSVVDEEMKAISHNMGIAEALYNAGYRKVSDSEAELQELNAKYYNEAKDLRRQLAYIEAENERLSERLKQVLLSIDTVKEMNAMCNIDEQRKQAVKEFAGKLKTKIQNFKFGATKEYQVNGVIFSSDIDKLLKEYEK